MLFYASDSLVCYSFRHRPPGTTRVRFFFTYSSSIQTHTHTHSSNRSLTLHSLSMQTHKKRLYMMEGLRKPKTESVSRNDKRTHLNRHQDVMKKHHANTMCKRESRWWDEEMQKRRMQKEEALKLSKRKEREREMLRVIRIRVIL